MVYYHSSISVCKSVDQPKLMAGSPNSTDSCSRSRNRKMLNSPNCLKSPTCPGSQSAAVDVAILIVVVSACGFLLFPYIKFVAVELVDSIGVILYMVGDEVSTAPWIYGSVGLSFFFAAIATFGVLTCTGRKCGNPSCKGLRKAAEFDIQLETEECVKKSSSLVRDGVKKGLFELPRDHHRELELELKKMAPANGRAILLFRARCGCSVGRLEVPGPRKIRKIKK